MGWGDILEEHAEDAAYLYDLRRRAFDRHAYFTADFGFLEERLRAHLDGLLLAGDEGWAAVAKGLESKKAGEAFTAAWLALAWGDAAALDALTAALAAPPSLEGLGAGMRLAEGPAVEAALRRFAAGDPLGPRSLALDALSFRGQPVEEPRVLALLAAPEPLPQLVGLGLAARVRLAAARPAVEKALRHEQPAIAAGALQAGFLLRIPGALEACRTTLTARGGAAVTAARMLGLLGEPRDAALLRAAVDDERCSRMALLALGRLGDASAVEFLIAQCADEKRARVAGHALAVLLGVNLAKEKLTLPPPPPPEGEEDTLETDPDDDLPLPAPERLENWWKVRRDEFDVRERLRRGVAWSEAAMADEVREGCLPDRDDAILELNLRHPSWPHVERRAWYARQREQAAELAHTAERTKPAAPAARAGAPARTRR